MRDDIFQMVHAEIEVLLENQRARSSSIQASTQMFVVVWVILVITVILMFSRLLEPRAGNLGLSLLIGLEIVMLAYVVFYNMSIRVERRGRELVEEQINLLLGKDTANFELKVAKTYSDFARPIGAFRQRGLNPIKITSVGAAFAGYVTYLSGVRAYLYYSNFSFAYILFGTGSLVVAAIALFLVAEWVTNRRFELFRAEVMSEQIAKWAQRLGVPKHVLKERIELGVIAWSEKDTR